MHYPSLSCQVGYIVHPSKYSCHVIFLWPKIFRFLGPCGWHKEYGLLGADCGVNVLIFSFLFQVSNQVLPKWSILTSKQFQKLLQQNYIPSMNNRFTIFFSSFLLQLKKEFYDIFFLVHFTYHRFGGFNFVNAIFFRGQIQDFKHYEFKVRILQ